MKDFILRCEDDKGSEMNVGEAKRLKMKIAGN